MFVQTVGKLNLVKMPTAKEMNNDLEFNSPAPNVRCTHHVVWCWACQMSGI